MPILASPSRAPRSINCHWRGLFKGKTPSCMAVFQFQLRHISGLLASGLVALFSAFSPALAQETQTVDVLGSITADVDGEQYKWLTISGGIEGMDGASAIWLPHSRALPAGVIEQMEQMSEQQRTAMDMIAGALGESNPLAAGEGLVDVRITGFDPEAERMLREGMLSIEVTRFPAQDLDAALSTRHDADVSYFRNRGPVTGLYVSAHSVGRQAQVEFDRLEIDAPGHAQGRFSATLCPINALMGREPDRDVCISISGEFASELIEETTSDGAP